MANKDPSLHQMEKQNQYLVDNWLRFPGHASTTTRVARQGCHMIRYSKAMIQLRWISDVIVCKGFDQVSWKS